MRVTTTQVGARGVGKFVVDTFFLLVFIAVFMFFSPPPPTEQVNWLRRRPFHGAVPTTLVMFAVVTTCTPYDKLSCFFRPNVTAADFFFLSYNVHFSPSLHLVILYLLSLPLLFTTRTCNTRMHGSYTKKPTLSAHNTITELEFKRPNEGLICWTDGKGKRAWE